MRRRAHSSRELTARLLAVSADARAKRLAMGLSPSPPEDAEYEALRAQARRPEQPTAHPDDKRAMAPILDRLNRRVAALDTELAVLDREGGVREVIHLGKGLAVTARGTLWIAGRALSVPEGAGGAVVREVGTGRTLFAL